jgi:hypothetical protein
MNINVSNHPSSTDSTRRVPNRGCKFSALLMLLAFAVSSPLAFCQSPPSSQPSPSQPPQSQPLPKDDSNTDAPKKTEKDKPKPKKVYTEADLSNLHGGVSVVGDSNSAASNSNGAASTAARPAGGKAGAGVVPMSGQDENYWRGRAKEILDEMAAIDQEIAKTKEDIMPPRSSSSKKENPNSRKSWTSSRKMPGKRALHRNGSGNRETGFL